MPTFLSAAELARLTGKKRRPAQLRALAALGYRKGYHFIVAATGEPLVLRNKLDADGQPAQRRGHRWDRIGSIRQLRT